MQICDFHANDANTQGHSHHMRGFTLIEILIATLILGAGVSFLVPTARNITQRAVDFRSETLALGRARESIEVVRFLRDENVSKSRSAFSGLSSPSGSVTSFLGSRDTSATNVTLLNPSAGNLATAVAWGLGPTDPGRRRLDVTSRWNGGGANQTVLLSAFLFDSAIGAPVIASFSATTPVNVNQPSTFTWTTSNADAITITGDGPSVPRQGAEYDLNCVAPSCRPAVRFTSPDIYTYTLTATGPRGTATRTTQIVVNTVGGPVPQCRDGADNDGDTLIDFPRDPGCDSRDDDDEIDNPPPVGETLSVSLLADPSVGRPTLRSTLTATASGTTTGPITWSLWWNCNDASSDVGIVSIACGPLPPPAGAGQCAQDTIGFKCLSRNENPIVRPHDYTVSGTYTPKVIVERGNAPNAESRDVIVVSPTLQQADLTITDFVVPGGQPNGLATANVTIRNTGNAITIPGLFFEVALNTTNDVTCGGVKERVTTRPPLRAGLSDSFTMPVTLPAAAGDYIATVMVDSRCEVGESNEGDNKQDASYRVALPPPTADIKANGSDGPVLINSGDQVRITWISTNATSCSVNYRGWTGLNEIIGRLTDQITSDTTFRLDCVGAGGSTVFDTVQVNVRGGPPPPPFGICGDETIQNPNSVGQREQCDKGAQNGVPGSGCTATCQNEVPAPPPLCPPGEWSFASSQTQTGTCDTATDVRPGSLDCNQRDFSPEGGDSCSNIGEERLQIKFCSYIRASTGDRVGCTDYGRTYRCGCPPGGGGNGGGPPPVIEP